MAVWRDWIKPIKYGEIMIFCISVSMLLYLYRGTHTNDSIYSLLRFIVGPCEEQGYQKKPQTQYVKSTDLFSKVKHYIQIQSTSASCPHNHSCLFYSMRNGLKLFAIGYGLNLCLKLLLQMKKIAYRPTLIFSHMFRMETFRLGAFFGGFGCLFRVVSCTLRRVSCTDSQFHAIPAGAVAGLSFFFYRDNTVALYFMWKALQIIYGLGAEKEMLPQFPHANIFFHAFATAVLFHAALLEPHNLRPSYWRFLTSVSGTKIVHMDRRCLDVFGVESSKSLQMAQSKRH
uniref:Transmembrane protein 135 N-terminal domain-containing protein n=1 Tax=Clastoptera arizonana TaxID=38151 RepID=A0A1B6CPS4_9HEMI